MCFLSFCESVWKLLNHDQRAQHCESLGGFGSNDGVPCLAGMGQEQPFKGTSLLYLHALPEDQTALKTHTFEPPLFQCAFLLKPSPGHEAQRTLWKVQMLVGAATHPENFPGPHQSPDAIRQRAQRSIVTRRPRFRGLLRGSAEGNTECHCCKQPGASWNMIPEQIAVQLCAGTRASSEAIHLQPWGNSLCLWFFFLVQTGHVNVHHTLDQSIASLPGLWEQVTW